MTLKFRELFREPSASAPVCSSTNWSPSCSLGSPSRHPTLQSPTHAAFHPLVANPSTGRFTVGRTTYHFHRYALTFVKLTSISLYSYVDWVDANDS